MCDTCRDRGDGPTTDLQAWAEMNTGRWGTYDPDDKEPHRDPWADQSDLHMVRPRTPHIRVRTTDRGADVSDPTGTAGGRHGALPVREAGMK